MSFFSFQLIEDHVDDSNANDNADPLSEDMETSNQEYSYIANGPGHSHSAYSSSAAYVSLLGIPKTRVFARTKVQVAGFCSCFGKSKLAYK